MYSRNRMDSPYKIILGLDFFQRGEILYQVKIIALKLSDFIFIIRDHKGQNTSLSDSVLPLK